MAQSLLVGMGQETEVSEALSGSFDSVWRKLRVQPPLRWDEEWLPFRYVLEATDIPSEEGYAMKTVTQ